MRTLSLHKDNISVFTVVTSATEQKVDLLIKAFDCGTVLGNFAETKNFSVTQVIIISISFGDSTSELVETVSQWEI